MSLVIMILNNIVGIIFVPVVVDLIDPVRFGIWITINSTLTWFSFLDIGLGGGLRTRLAQALALNDDRLAKQYISTAYTFIGTMVILVMCIFVLVYRHINWVRVFNAPSGLAQELYLVMLLVVVLFLSRMILQLINSIMMAFQMTYLTSLASFISHFFSLLVVFILFRFVSPSLWAIAVVYSLSPVIVLSITTIVFFSSKRFKKYKPDIKSIKMDSLSSIMSLGVFEFIDKASGVAVITLTNIMISHLGTPADVVPYNVSMRVVGFFVTVAYMITEPMTPAFTDAYTKNDLSWIKRVVKKINLASLAVVFCLILSIPILKPAVEFLLRGKVKLSFSILILVVLLSSQRIMSNVYGRFVTGTGKIRLIVLVTAVSALLFYPVVLGLGKLFSFGVISVVIAQLCIEFPATITKWKQATLIITGKAKGIWYK